MTDHEQTSNSDPEVVAKPEPPSDEAPTLSSLVDGEEHPVDPRSVKISRLIGLSVMARTVASVGYVDHGLADRPPVGTPRRLRVDRVRHFLSQRLAQPACQRGAIRQLHVSRPITVRPPKTDGIGGGGHRRGRHHRSSDPDPLPQRRCRRVDPPAAVCRDPRHRVSMVDKMKDTVAGC